MLYLIVASEAADTPPLEVATYTHWQSREYKRRTEGLKLSPEDALRAANQWRKNRPGPPRPAGLLKHYVLVGNDYLFTYELEKTWKGIGLRGLYIDGNTGEVAERGEGLISDRQQQSNWGFVSKKSYPFQVK